MRIQDNLCNTSFRSLHFVKYKPVFNKKLTYEKDAFIEGMKTTKEGIKYIDDINISSEMKNAISNTPIIKKLAKEFETFIVYSEGVNNAISEKFYSLLRIYHVDPSKPTSIKNEIIGCDKNSYFNARQNCINKLNKE